jgi:hypothetical protein
MSGGSGSRCAPGSGYWYGKAGLRRGLNGLDLRDGIPTAGVCILLFCEPEDMKAGTASWPFPPSCSAGVSRRVRPTYGQMPMRMLPW